MTHPQARQKGSPSDNEARSWQRSDFSYRSYLGTDLARLDTNLVVEYLLDGMGAYEINTAGPGRAGPGRVRTGSLPGYRHLPVPWDT